MQYTDVAPITAILERASAIWNLDLLIHIQAVPLRQLKIIAACRTVRGREFRVVVPNMAKSGDHDRVGSRPGSDGYLSELGRCPYSTAWLSCLTAQPRRGTGGSTAPCMGLRPWDLTARSAACWSPTPPPRLPVARTVAVPAVETFGAAL
jgi:hypothetical protein